MLIEDWDYTARDIGQGKSYMARGIFSLKAIFILSKDSGGLSSHMTNFLWCFIIKSSCTIFGILYDPTVGVSSPARGAILILKKQENKFENSVIKGVKYNRVISYELSISSNNYKPLVQHEKISLMIKTLLLVQELYEP